MTPPAANQNAKTDSRQPIAVLDPDGAWLSVRNDCVLKVSRRGV